MINLFHILCISPLLMYIGYNKININNDNNTSIILLLVILVMTSIYHMTRYLDNMNEHKNINMYHIIIILILLYFTVYDNNIYYKSLMILAILVIMIHVYKLMVNIHKINNKKKIEFNII
jgi:energy-coupling factor transporter transmembrane protein EcfT